MNGPQSALRRRSGIGLTSSRARQRLAEQLQRRGIRSQEVLEQIRRAPRHLFIDEALERYAYQDNALPIGAGQTISQPYIAAFMSERLRLQSAHTVLEIGTGSGYQAAVLSVLVDEVYSIEIIPALAESAAERLAHLGYENVTVKAGDGYFGWPEAAPFDGIIVTAVGPDLPAALLAQHQPGGRMVLPVGTQHSAQNLTVVTRRTDGGIDAEQVLPVAFVPLTGDH